MNAEAFFKGWIEEWEVAPEGCADPRAVLYLLIDWFFRTHPGGFSKALFEILRFVDRLWHGNES